MTDAEIKEFIRAAQIEGFEECRRSAIAAAVAHKQAADVMPDGYGAACDHIIVSIHGLCGGLNSALNGDARKS